MQCRCVTRPRCIHQPPTVPGITAHPTICHHKNIGLAADTHYVITRTSVRTTNAGNEHQHHQFTPAHPACSHVPWHHHTPPPCQQPPTTQPRASASSSSSRHTWCCRSEAPWPRIHSPCLARVMATFMRRVSDRKPIPPPAREGLAIAEQTGAQQKQMLTRTTHTHTRRTHAPTRKHPCIHAHVPLRIHAHLHA